jgi:hypothetical protein
MTETDDAVVPDEVAETDEAESLTELLEQLGRELGVLALRESRLEASRNMPEIRRAARDGAGAAVAALALLTAFVFANVAALHGLSSAVPGWLAALVLAAVWIAVAGALALGVLGRARRGRLWSALTAGPADADTTAELERARDEAVGDVRETLERLGPAIALALASAAIPMAGDLAEDLAGGVVDAGDGLLDASDEIVEAIAAELPAGSVVNQIWDVALMPGRFGLRIATTVLRRDTRGD